MFVLRRIRFLVLCAAAIAAAAFAVHTVMQPVVAGKSITWATQTPATPSTSMGPIPAGALPRTSATPSPMSGPLDGLRQPLGALLRRLNADTGHTATGQYSILQSLEQALRDHIEQFLNWIVGRR